MEMLRHDDVSHDCEFVTLADVLQRLYKLIAGDQGRREQRSW